MNTCFVTNCNAVNLRRSGSTRSNILAVLYVGHECTSIDESGTWWEVKTEIENIPYSGFIHSHYLTHTDHIIGAVAGIPKVHLSEGKVSVDPNSESRAHAIGDPSRVIRDLSTTSSRVSTIHKIIDYLDVENSNRYIKEGYTFCNIYAYDFCYLSGVYLPRVWWTGTSIISMIQGNNVQVRYNDTVTEIRANEIFHWFRDFGPTFGWRRVFSTQELQAAADQGKIGVVVANTKNHSKAGHIAVVVPQTAEHTPVTREGRVVTPVMSQAGSKNKKYYSYRWWTKNIYSFFGYWVHD